MKCVHIAENLGNQIQSFHHRLEWENSWQAGWVTGYDPTVLTHYQVNIPLDVSKYLYIYIQHVTQTAS